KTRARQRAAPWRPFPRRRCRRRKTLLPLADHVNNQPRQLLLLVFVGRFPKLLEDALLRVLRVNVVREEIANDLRFVGDLPVAHAHGAADVNGLGQGLPPLGPVLHLQVQPVSTPFRLENVRAINVPWRPVSYVCLLRGRCPRQRSRLSGRWRAVRLSPWRSGQPAGGRRGWTVPVQVDRTKPIPLE